ncbi:MAG: 3-deoxy-7-phosphoheptulonate synthase [Pseudomonadota bacterium]
MRIENVNVATHEVLVTPQALKAALPLTHEIGGIVQQTRHQVCDIVARKSARLLAIVGPCSIHDPAAALDYAKHLAALQTEVPNVLLVMRAYFEKPRTTVGWKGLINDPYLDDSCLVGDGLRIARQLLLDIAAMGLPLATEALDPIIPQYLQDLISWSAIGARTTESQTHREMASGLSCAVGFKNGTDGSLNVAINALEAATTPHRFMGINPEGQVSLIHTTGNPHAHIVLRGGSHGPNYSAKHVKEAEAALTGIATLPSIMVDCSHANSGKDHKKQGKVLQSIIEQINDGNDSIIGVMVESNLVAGKQPLDLANGLRYGVSVTDACIDWQETATLMQNLNEAIEARQVAA